MKTIDYSNIVAKLDEIAIELALQDNYEEMEAVQKEIDILTEWLENEQPDPPPQGWLKYKDLLGNIMPENPELVDGKGVTTEINELDLTSPLERLSSEDIEKSDIDTDQLEKPIASTDDANNEPIEYPAIRQDLQLPFEVVEEELGVGSFETDESPVDGLGIETPEMKALRKQLDQARVLYEQSHLSEAVALSRAIVGQNPKDVQLKEAAEDLLDRAQRDLKKMLEDNLNRANLARQRGEIEEAHRYYSAALDLDRDNRDAHQGLFSLGDQFSSQSYDEVKINRIRSGLRMWRKIEHGESNQSEIEKDSQEKKLLQSRYTSSNLVRLETSIYEAEVMEAEGKLPGDMVIPLREARKAFDEIRIAMGQETTAMRFSDLVARKAARDSIAARVGRGEIYIFDETLNEDRPAPQVLEEANILLEEASQDTAQYEIDRAQKLREQSPRVAKNRLEVALEKPFHESHKRILQAQLDEIGLDVTKLEEAERLLDWAAHEIEPVEHLKLALQAQAMFPALEGLEAQINQSRTTAASILAARMRGYHNQAEACLHIARLQKDKYQEARNELKLADAVPATWPEEQKPAIFQELLDAGEALRQRINQHQAFHQELIEKVESIRSRLLDPDLRQSGMNMLIQVKDDERFIGFLELEELISEADQYRDIGDQLAEARAARMEEDWERVKHLALLMLSSGKTGQFSQEVEALLSEAQTELEINQVRKHMEDDELREAFGIINRLTAQVQDENLKAELSRRFSTDLERIHQAINNTPPMEELFNQAKVLAENHGYPERLLALKLFRHIGGDTSETPQGKWPEYRISLYTTAARKAARNLSQYLRQELLLPIQEAFYNQQDKPLSLAQLREMAEKARALREAHLLETEDERACIRWLEVEQGKRDAQGKEDMEHWDDAVGIWRDLDLNHPRIPEIESRLHNALIQQAIFQARRLCDQDQSGKALELLKNLQAESNMSRAWELILTLADIYLERGEFPQAFESLKQAERNEECRKLVFEKRQEFQREQAIQIILEKARSENQSGQPAEALRILKDALKKEPTCDSHRVERYLGQVFTESETLLLQKARQEQASGTDQGKILAVQALVVLSELEIIFEKPIKERRSIPALAPLRSQINDVAKKIVDEAAKFDPSFMQLGVAIEQVSILVGRLQTFVTLTQLSKELDQDTKRRLETFTSRLGTAHQNLVKLQSTLEDANQTELWQQAIKHGDFYILILEQFKQQIQQLDLDDMLEVRTFYQRLTEWKALYELIFKERAFIKRKFSGEEDFEAVIQKISDLATQPDLQANGQLWQQIRRSDYEDIYCLMGAGLHVKPYGDEKVIVGWSAVGQAARERQVEYEQWVKWSDSWWNRMEAAEQAIARSDKHDIHTPLVQQEQDWLTVRDKSLIALEFLEAGAMKEEQRVPIRSRKANKLWEEGSSRLRYAREWLMKAQQKLEEISPKLNFPTAKEFDDAVRERDWDRLERILDRAREVGSTMEDDIKRIEIYSQILKKIKETGRQKESFISKILNRIFRPG